MLNMEIDELTQFVTNMTPVGKTIVRHAKTLPVNGFDSTTFKLEVVC